MKRSSQELYTGLEDMTVKGGGDIGIVAAQALHAYAIENSEETNFLDKVETFGEQLKRVKPTMATVHNAVDAIVSILSEYKDEPLTGIAEVEMWVQNYESTEEQALEKLATHYAGFLKDGDVLLTHSYTHTVLMALERASKQGIKFQVISTESRPLREGAYLASLLAGRDIEVTIITDAAVAHYLPQVTKIAVGADALYADGTVVNKMGTLGLGMLARAYKKPLFVLATTAKYYPPSLAGERLRMERRPKSEVLDEDAYEEVRDYLSVKNVFFEEVPAEYIGHIVTEYGLIKPSQLLTIVSTKE
jgi:ribose 1,5-bisphosphate isomerase